MNEYMAFLELCALPRGLLLNAEARDKTLPWWMMLWGSFKIPGVSKHWFLVDVGPETSSSLPSTAEVSNYVLRHVFLVASPSQAEGSCGISVGCFLFVTRCVWCVTRLPSVRHVWPCWRGWTGRVSCRRLRRKVPLCAHDCTWDVTLSPCLFLTAVLQGQPRWLGENVGESAEQLGERTQVVWPPKGLEQHGLRGLQPQSQARHDQDGEFWGHHGAEQGWQHVQYQEYREAVQSR